MDAGLAALGDLSGWVYLVIFVVVALDAVVPVAPSEGVVITGAVLAAQGELALPLVVLVGAAGALGGDLASFAIGRHVARRRTGPSARSRVGRAMAWAQDLLDAHGPGTLVVARFVPGGRTATTFTAGFVGMDPGRYTAGVATGAVLWATLAGAVGHLGGTVFEPNPLLGLAVGLGAGTAVGVGIEVARSRVARRRVTPPIHAARSPRRPAVATCE